MPNITESDLYSLRLDGIYEFTLYYGEKVIGCPIFENNTWYIINPISPNKIQKQIIPAQIESYRKVSFTNNHSSKINNSFSINGTPSFKTLIIIGAGASYDYSFNEATTRPPLTKDLFNNTFIKDLHGYPGVENLSSQILQSKNIEMYFQQQWEKIVNSFNPILLNKIIDVQFYLHTLFRTVSNDVDYRMNNYSSFFQALRDYLIQKGDNEKALIVSFNYDTILEQTLQKAFRYSFSAVDDYINFDKRRFLLFKPHGSWNWIRNFRPEFLTQMGIANNSIIQSLNNIVYQKGISLGSLLSNLEDDISILSGTESPYFYPELLIPFTTKDSYVMPDVHLNILSHFLNQVEKIIVLGWKGTEEKFKNLLKQRLSHKKLSILYVTAKDKTIEDELKDILHGATFSELAPYETSKGTFTELNTFIQEYPDRIFE